MPIIHKRDIKEEQRYPGVRRWEMVGKRNSKSMLMGELIFTPGSKIPTHTHPNEEAMLITEGHLEAVLGDERMDVGPGDMVLAPAGVKHGFVNRSGADAKMTFVHPVVEPPMIMTKDGS